MAEKKSPKSFIVTLNDEKKQLSVEKVPETDKKKNSAYFKFKYPFVKKFLKHN